MFQTFRAIGRDRALSARIILLLFAFSVPLAGAGTLLIAQENARIVLTERERGVVGTTQQTLAIVSALRTMRDDRVFGIGSQAVDRAAVDRAFAQGRQRSAPATEDRRLPLLGKLEANWRALPRKRAGTVDPIVRESVNVLLLENDRAAIVSDADQTTALLLDADGFQLPTAENAFDDAEIRRATSLERRYVDPADALNTAFEAGLAVHAFAMAQTDVRIAGRFDPAMRAEVTPLIDRSASDLRSFALDSVDQQLQTWPAVRLQAFGETVRGHAGLVHLALERQVLRRLQARESRERRSLMLYVIETALALFVTIGIALLIVRTIFMRDREELARVRRDADGLQAELARQRELEALAVSEAQFRAVFDRSFIGVGILDRSGAILRTNEALLEMFEGKVDAAQIGAAHPDFERLIGGQLDSFATELRFERRGLPVWFEVTVSLIRDYEEQPLFALAMLRDVTERKQTADRLEHDATHDALSGLPNRTQFAERLHATFFAGRCPERSCAVLFVDLDEFKFVNDSLGHAVGDRVLIAVAQRLGRAIGERDIVARIGGDEFAVLLADRGDRAAVEATVMDLERAIAQPLSIGDREIFMTASIGVALPDSTYADVEQIMRDADTAMYCAKTAGRARYAVFDRSMHEQSARRLEVATQLRRALERSELTLAYQPTVSLVTGRYEACEALVRWEHPVLGNVPPVEFIPLAEEIGMIVPIGRFVMERACAQIAAWKQSGLFECVPRVSVNASVREVLQNDYPAYVEATIARYGIAPGELMVEVTESAVLASDRFSAGALDRIKAAGVGLSIDDFGTGYSSLRYLQHFPFDELKIDRSFVSGSHDGLESEAIVMMLLALGRAFDVKITAEGVETPAQAERLRILGCTSAQGYLFGKPVRPERLPEFFVRRAVAAV